MSRRCLVSVARKGLLLSVCGVAGCATWVEEDALWFDGPGPPTVASAVEFVPRGEALERPDAFEEDLDRGEAHAELRVSTRIGWHCTLTSHVTQMVPMLSPQDIRATVQRHENEVRACYNRALVRDPAAAGRVLVTFVIDGDGSVPVAAVEASEIADSRMHVCLTEAVKSWSFPTAPGTRTSLVHYPYVFSVPDRTRERYSGRVERRAQRPGAPTSLGRG